MEIRRNCLFLHILITAALLCEALTTAQLTTRTSQQSADCPPSKTSSLNWRSYQDSCFAAPIERFYTYNEGRDFCIQNGGHLASIHSEDELVFIGNMTGVRMYFWIGLRRIYPDEIIWEDGTPVSYVNWSDDDDDYFRQTFDGPDYDSFDDTCVSFLTSTGLWVKLSCEIHLPVICKYSKLSGAASTTAAPTGFCPEGWYTFGDNCYMLGGKPSSETKGWNDASRECEAINSQLASVHSAREQNFLNTLVMEAPSSLWIGLSRPTSGDDFRWTDDSPLDYSNWAVGEPNNRRTEEICVEMQKASYVLGKWNDMPCKTKFPYICKRPRDPTITQQGLDPSLCTEPEGWMKIKNSCFQVFNEVQSPTTWDKAQYACANKSAILASVKSFQATVQLRTHMKEMDGYFWIGLSSTSKQRYTWIGGAPLIYNNWQSDQPKDVSDENNCVAMDTEGQWMIKNCNENLPFICEVSKEQLPAIASPGPNMTCPKYSPKWHDLGGQYCYIIEVEQKIRSYEASCLCSNEGGYLTSFHSTDEINLMVHYLGDISVPLHIGFERDTRGRFLWADGSPSDFDNWERGQPSSDIEHCSAMDTKSGKWYHVHCSARHGYICSVLKVPLEKETAPPSMVSRIGQQHSASEIVSITLSTLSVLVIVAVSLCYFYPSLKTRIASKIPFGKLQS